MRTFTQFQKDFATFTGNTSTTSNATNTYDNISWGMRMINDSIRYLATVFYFNEASFIVPGGTVANQQGYQLPSDFEQLNTLTIQIGGLLWQAKESPSRAHFNALNVIPFYNDFPQYYYIWNNQILIYPTPASSSNILTLYYKKRIVDLAMDDVTQATATSTMTATLTSSTVTASSTTFKKWMAVSGWINIPYSTTDSASGDNKWYQLDTYTSGTVMALKNAYTGVSVTGASFTVGDVPILPEDYQDLPLYRACRLYFTSRVSDPVKAQTFKDLYDEGYQKLDDKYGSKTTSPVLTDINTPVYNPNLFPRSLS